MFCPADVKGGCRRLAGGCRVRRCLHRRRRAAPPPPPAVPFDMHCPTRISFNFVVEAWPRSLCCAASCCFQLHSVLFCWVLQEGQSVTLEPGGQFELSGATLESLHQTCAEVNSHLYQVSARLPLGGAVAAASPCPPPVSLQPFRGDLPLSCCPCPALPALPTCCRCGRYVRSWALPFWGLALTPSGATRTCPACPRPGGCGWDSADRGGSVG